MVKIRWFFTHTRMTCSLFCALPAVGMSRSPACSHASAAHRHTSERCRPPSILRQPVLCSIRCRLHLALLSSTFHSPHCLAFFAATAAALLATLYRICANRRTPARQRFLYWWLGRTLTIERRSGTMSTFARRQVIHNFTIGFGCCFIGLNVWALVVCNFHCLNRRIAECVIQ